MLRLVGNAKLPSAPRACAPTAKARNAPESMGREMREERVSIGSHERIMEGSLQLRGAPLAARPLERVVGGLGRSPTLVRRRCNSFCGIFNQRKHRIWLTSSRQSIQGKCISWAYARAREWRCSLSRIISARSAAGRISKGPARTPGCFDISWMAWLRSFASRIRMPPICSLVSA